MKNPDYIEVIGVMSGTSLDGLDMAWCRFSVSDPAAYTLISTKSIPYEDDLKAKLADAVYLSAEALFALDVELGKMIGNSILTFIDSQENKPDIIASHGHTIFHQPDKGFTVQIGNASHIYALTGISVISDFRSLDVALGGQGAPLVPIGDQLLFSDFTHCLNLGGIANISFTENNQRVAYDICPCNMILNHLAARLNLPYDEDGAIAASGTEIVNLDFSGWDYYAQKPPKSLGYEHVSAFFFPKLKDGETANLLNTCVLHIAKQIALSCGNNTGRMLITGGGAHNGFLRKKLAESIPDMEIVYPEKAIVDFKEAIVFAMLGALHAAGKPNVLSSVTGSSRDNIGGQRIG